MKKRNRRCDPAKQAHWEEVVRRWKLSGRSVRDYCRTEGLRESAFYFWRRELTRRGQVLETGKGFLDALASTATGVASPQNSLENPS